MPLKPWCVVEYDRATGRQSARTPPRFWTSWGAWRERQRLIRLWGNEYIYQVAKR
jgi:hypothetical protein